MTTAVFKRMCENLTEISKLNEPARENNLKLFMSQGYLFLDLTDKQVYKLKGVLSANYPTSLLCTLNPTNMGSRLNLSIYVSNERS